MRILFFLFLFTSITGFSQIKNPAIENGSIFRMKDGSLFIGELVSYNESPYKLKIITGDTITINPLLTKRIYLPDDIFLYNKGKWSYKQGLLVNAAFGVANEHNSFDMDLSFAFQKRYLLGFGLGFHNNFLGIQTATSEQFGDVRSSVYFLKGQYFILNRSFRIYASGKVGFANNIETRQIPEVSNGIMLSGGIGISFASKNRAKYFLELSQYTTQASGILVSNDVNALSDIIFDVWFNRVIFTFGVQFGK